ncbi:MAG: DUF2269 family protein [Candidatus Cohnella colombiensis]|uniref:DUF2269 family protein n=1 Tax=Candidatus Cohnella colombiensis TaxID=3121368 RepID=A0AA95EVQ6_9BACL|nr:MAG: DUF2269 family protein [Cohnella sp.]
MSITGYLFSENWLTILIIIHVLSAIIGVGPTFFGHVLLRKGQTLGQLRGSLALSLTLEKFPKILGSVAVVTGILLAWLGDYGFDKLWIYLSIADYIIIQVVVIAFMAPAGQKAAALVFAANDPLDQQASPQIAAAVSRANAITYIPTVLGVLLFLLMFLKPIL